MIRVGALGAIALLAVSALVAWPASAHGPCSDCIRPLRGAPGTVISVRWTAIRVVWNPSRRMLPYGDDRLRRTWHDDEPTVTVFRSKRPRRSRFRVPDVGRGTYGIAIFDGSEGGTHYTWAYFDVHERVRRAASAHSDGEPDDGAGVAPLALTGVSVLLISALVLLRTRRRSRPQQ